MTGILAEPRAGATSAEARARRWLVGLMFLAIMLNYVDRQIIALLKPTLQAQFGWSEGDYGHLASAFQFAAAIGCLGGGWFIDRVGLKRGFATGVGVWSLAAMAHALVSSMAAFVAVRVVLGMAEATGTPAVVKTAGTYFPPVDRTRALGLSGMAPSFGAVLAPLLIPPLAAMFGWRAAFLGAGAAGLVWVAGWLGLRISPPPAAPPGDLGASPAASAAARIGWRGLLGRRQTWAFIIAKSLADLTWWFLLFFMPDLFHRLFHLPQGWLGLPVAAVYAMAAAGAVSGGWLYGKMLARAWPPPTARMATLLAFAVPVLAAPLVIVAPGAWPATLALGLVLFAFQGFSTNLFATATDLFPAAAIGSAIGLAAFAGNLAGIGILELAGFSLERGYGYGPILAIIAVSALLSLAVLRSLTPGLEPISIGQGGAHTG